MSTQIVCDGCGEPIDVNATYYHGEFKTVQVIDGVQFMGVPVEKHYHAEHLPSDDLAIPELPEAPVADV